MIRAWLRLMWTSMGVAAVAAAAQLGITDAFGIVRWSAEFQPGDEATWDAMLTWVAFSFAVAVLAGVASGRRGMQREQRSDTAAARAAAIVGAGVGALAAASIGWLQARAATPPVSVSPELVVTLTAGAGVVAGMIIAALAVSAPPIAGGVRIAVVWTWLAGIGSAATGLGSEASTGPRLGVIDAPSLVPSAWWSGPYAMVGIAAIAGFAVAGLARWAGAGRAGIAFSGFAGPALIASAYLVAGPGEGTARAYQAEPYQASLIAVAVGLVAGVLVALPTRPDAAGHESGTAAGRSEPERPPRDRAAPVEDVPAHAAGRPAGHAADPATGHASPYPGSGGYDDRPSEPGRHARAGYEQAPQERSPDERATYPQSPYEQNSYGSGAYEQAQREQSPYDSVQYGDRGQHNPPNRYEQPQEAYLADTAERPVIARAAVPGQPSVTTPPAPQATPPAPPGASLMGQPPDDYADWLKDLGQGGRRDQS